ncbi:DsbA family protein [Oerskovia sp. M15]
MYLDYMCPICGQFEEINSASLDEMREAGDVNLVLHPVAILDRMANAQQFSTRSAAAAAYVAEHAPRSSMRSTRRCSPTSPRRTRRR